jgi:hypothetical protein
LLLVGLLTAATPAPWGDLSNWVGKYPTDQDAKPVRHLLQMPAVRAELSRILGPADLKLIASYAVESPIEMIDGLLIDAQCMPHNCGDQSVMLVIDPKQPRIWVGFFSRAPSLVSTRWYGPTDHHELPPAVLRQFESRHGP